MRDNLRECKVLNDQFVQHRLKHNTIYGLSGIIIKTLKHETQKSGYYQNNFDLRGLRLTSGIYYLGLQLEHENIFKKLVIIR